MSYSTALITILVTVLAITAGYPLYEDGDDDNSVLVLLEDPDLDQKATSDYVESLSRHPRSFHVHSTVRWTSKMGSQRRQKGETVHKKKSDSSEGIVPSRLRRERLAKRQMKKARMQEFDYPVYGSIY